jgi:hypothetical protein
VPEPEYISIVELLQNKDLWTKKEGDDRKSPRQKPAFMRLLRERYKLKLRSVVFPGKNNGRAVLAITKEEAKELIKKMTTVQVLEEPKE